MSWEAISKYDYIEETTWTLGFDYLNEPNTVYVNDDSPFGLWYSHIGFIQVPDNVNIADLDLNAWSPGGFIDIPDLDYYLEEAKKTKLLEMGYDSDAVEYGFVDDDNLDLDDVKPNWNYDDMGNLLEKIVEESTNCSDTELSEFGVDVLEDIDEWYRCWVYEQLKAKVSDYFTYNE